VGGEGLSVTGPSTVHSAWWVGDLSQQPLKILTVEARPLKSQAWMRGEAAEALGALTAEVRGLGRRLEALEVAGGAVDRSPQALDARLRRIERILSLEPAAAGREEPMPALDESSVRPETGGLQADGGGEGAGSDSLYARALWSDGEGGVLLPGPTRRRRKEGLYRCVRAAVLRASEERGSERIGRLEVGDIVRAEWWENEPYGGCQGAVATAATTRVHCIAPGRDWLPCVGLRRLQAGGEEGQQGCLTGWASVTAGGGRALLVALSERVLPLPEGGPGASYVARVRVQLRDRPAVSSAAVGAGGVIAAGGRGTVEEVVINEAGQPKLRLSLAGGSGWASFVGISNHQPLFTAAGGLEEEEAAAAGLPPPSKDPTGEEDEGGRQRSTSVGGGGAQWVAGLKQQAVEVEELRLRMDAMERRHQRAEEVKLGELGRRLQAMERAMEPPPPPPQPQAAAMAAGPRLLPLRGGGAPAAAVEGAALSGAGGVGTEEAAAAAASASSAAAALLVTCVLRQVEDEWTAAAAAARRRPAG
jgi:hypothetical protein